MATLYYHHADFLNHDTGLGHPENADRLRYIDKALSAPEFGKLLFRTPSLDDALQKKIVLIHPQLYIDSIMNAIPEQDYQLLDNDTVLSPGTGVAALLAVSAVCEAVDNICQKQADNAFCAIRPPGHHAEPQKAMGFCLFNNVAIAAAYAREYYQLERIAIIDFDVHHGNGTQAAFYQQAKILYISSHEMPNFPGTGYPSETGVGNIINIPLAAGTGSHEFRQNYYRHVFPAIKHFKPELMLLSAGFDAHKDDPLASIMLTEQDYAWLTGELLEIADQYASGRIISALEGGYNLNALANSVAAHVKVLLEY